MEENTVQILWDASRFWGLLAYRGLSALGVPCKFILAKDIAQGSLLRKPSAILLVPGGSAYAKARALGPQGMETVRRWINDGGQYLGFCGGAGLALTQNKAESCLGICPWERRTYPARIYHLISGSVWAWSEYGRMALPVWWPGRFEESGGTEILARYESPGPDLWLADLPLREVPPAVFSHWAGAGRLDPSLDFPAGQPLVIRGKYGHGSYVLSYAHLETPGYRDANGWLLDLLRHMGYQDKDVPAAFGGEAIESGAYEEWIERALKRVRGFIASGKTLGLYFTRTEWLLGWRHGAPGMACNNLLACLEFLADKAGVTPPPMDWEEKSGKLQKIFDAFMLEAEEFLWNFRLQATLGTGLKKLEQERNRLFGHPMRGGGKLEDLLKPIEKLVYLQQGN